MPGVGQLERITFEGSRAELLAEGFFYNDVTGTGAVQAASSGDRYTARSVAPVRPESLAHLQPGTSVLPAAPELPEALAELLDGWAPASEEPGRRLHAVIEGFQREGYVSHGIGDEPPSRSGHALDRLAELATARPMVGDGEQYAVAAALMARKIGFPARVVVGYLARSRDPLPEPGGVDGCSAATTCRPGSRCRPPTAPGCRSTRTRPARHPRARARPAHRRVPAAVRPAAAGRAHARRRPGL